ncbi:MAG: rhodanese-like domain-containing protein [Patescibacteria group bacterium]
MKNVVILFYKFIDITEPESLVRAHKVKCAELGLLGRMIVAEEGINATFEGTRESIEKYKEFIKSDARFADILIKESVGNGKAFTKLKIKVRDEVVALEAGKFDIERETAKELPASELAKWYENNEDFVVLDLRNDYEIASGKFEKTIDPGLTNFRDLPEKLKDLENLKDKKVVAVCTGGIRCEKATCLLKRSGFSNLYQLKDGIHTYMKEYPGKNFKGTLFVFDNRMTTDVTEISDKEIIGKCVFCAITTESYCSDDTTRPSKKVLCCEKCFEINKSHLRESVSR